MIAGVLTKAITADATIVAGLALYAGVPAIFTAEIPDDCGLPAIVINDIGGTRWGTRGQKGAELAVDVTIYGKNLLSKKVIRDLAYKIWHLLNRHELSPWLEAEGYDNWGCLADPPTATNDGNGFPGFTVKVTVRVLKT